MHAEDIAVAENILRPSRKHASDAVAEHRGLPEVEIEGVGELQCNGIARVIDRKLVVDPGRVGEIALEPCTSGADVPPLAIVRAIRQRRRGV